jgi:hypothetical protein
MLKKFKGVLVPIVSGSFLLPVLASAQSAITFDPAPVLDIVNQAQTFIVTIGLAVLSMLMVAKGIKWARKAG